MDEPKKNIDEATDGFALTRREWLMSLAGAALLSGFQPMPAVAGQEAQSVAGALPLGLYSPSVDHLSHALSSNELFVPITPGSETEYVLSGPFVPQSLAQEESAVVRRLVEIILGEDLKNSPQQSARGEPASIYDEVAEWIDLVVASAPRVRTLAQNLPAEQRALAVAYFGSEEPVRELETFEPERVCQEGLAWLREESQRRFAKNFLNAERAKQAELVQAISDVRPDNSSVHAGTRLFDFLKAESIRGFYTSRLGLKELNHKANSFYAKSPGCGLLTGSQPAQSKSE